MIGLHPIDLGVVIFYLVGITALGVWMARQVKSVSDFFMPRKFGKAMMITNAFGTGTASDQAVVVASATFRNGLSGIWWQWIWLPATPFYWLIAPIMRRLRAVTTADAYTLRYDRSVAMLFAVVGIAGLAVKIGLMLVGSGALVHATTAGAITSNWAIGMITVMFVLYGTAGGLGAAIVTDFFQGLLTIVFSFLLLPFVLQAVGGMEGIRTTINDPAMLELAVPGQIGVFFVIMYSIQALIGIVAQPFIMGVCASGRTEMDGRVGFMVGNIVKRLCTMAWSITALAAVAWYMQRGVDLSTIKGDHVYGDIARAFLPGVAPGLLGLFIASLLASVMSSCDAFMISSAGLFTENIYKPFNPGRTQREYLLVGRITSLVVVAAALLFVWYVKVSASAEGKSPVVESLKIWFKIAPMMGVTFWMGLLWRKATVAGAWATTIAGFTAWWMAEQTWFVDWIASLPVADTLRLIWRESGQPDAIYEPWVVVFYTVAAVAVGVLVSLVTRPVDPEKLDLFYDLTRTPVTDGEVVSAPCTMPAGVKAPARPMLLTAGGLEIPMPSRTSWLGFLGGWLAVAALIIGFVWIVS
jgi:Na+/proline symporter